MEAKRLEELDHRAYILAKHIRQNNLKGIDVAIPQNQFIVVTGVSGSGKTSLAFDTLYAEGQRRYIESLSAYIRQFLGKINKPDVDYIKGLAPAIAIKQKVSTANPRSTVGTFSEIYDYLKLLYARIGRTISPISGEEVKRHTVQDMLDFIQAQPEGAKFQVLAPVHKPAERSWKDEFSVILQKGFNRVKIGNTVFKVEQLVKHYEGEEPLTEKAVLDTLNDQAYLDAHTHLIVDRLTVNHDPGDDWHTRVTDSLQTALFEAEGSCILEFYDQDKQPIPYEFNNRFELDGMQFEEPSVNLFTFNSPYGACPTCEGFGQTIGLDEDKVIPDKSLSIYEDAVACWKGDKMSQWKKAFIKNAKRYDFPIHKPYRDLTREQKRLLWNGASGVDGLNDFFQYLERKSYKIQYRVLLARYKGKTTCPTCFGTRLCEAANHVKINGTAITELVNKPISEVKDFFDNITLTHDEAEIAKRLLTEIENLTTLLCEVGLGYLSLNRPANTLSGGETQRIQLVTSLGSNLTGSLYILDEPSVGLHPRDNDRLVKVLKNLKALGNTVIVVEHDEAIIRAADHILDIGPYAGNQGGELIFQGDVEALLEEGQTLTADYLNGRRLIPPDPGRRNPEQFLEVEGANRHNLKSLDIAIPLQAISVITGVSGSGKSTLVGDVLQPSLQALHEQGEPSPYCCKAVHLPENGIQRVAYVDQNPLGKSSRSNPVTYLKAFDPIRELFADQPAAKAQGFTPAYFSFNVDGGRCDNCKGEGYITVEMQFMADIHLTCEECNGKRFKPDVLKITYQDQNIAEVLEMTVNEALTFFKQERSIVQQLQPLADVGLGYIKLGQPSINLSGGEAQRIKLASFLTRQATTEPMLFIFDEPTTGLHFHDIHNLLNAFHALVNRGHTILIVEHNLDIIKSADWVIDLGPEGGEAGGYCLYQGSPDGIMEQEGSHTGQYLKEKVLHERKLQQVNAV